MNFAVLFAWKDAKEGNFAVDYFWSRFSVVAESDCSGSTSRSYLWSDCNLDIRFFCWGELDISDRNGVLCREKFTRSSWSWIRVASADFYLSHTLSERFSLHELYRELETCELYWPYIPGVMIPMWPQSSLLDMDILPRDPCPDWIPEGGLLWEDEPLPEMLREFLWKLLSTLLSYWLLPLI